MRDYDQTTYGERVADLYDELYGALDPGPAASFLADLAGAGPALELGIGTGRVALPLKERGVEVHGIDASPAMVERLRAKPGGADLPVTIGDFADVAPAGPFSLVFVVFNTLFALPTQDDQVRCFGNVAARLAPGGRFVVEAFVPDLTRFHHDQALLVTAVEVGGVRIDASRHDRLAQRISAQHVIVGERGVRLVPVELRYAWPAELDLMARVAGLRHAGRWGGWAMQPFTAASGVHVSVYEKL